LSPVQNKQNGDLTVQVLAVSKVSMTTEFAEMFGEKIWSN